MSEIGDPNITNQLVDKKARIALLENLLTTADERLENLTELLGTASAQVIKLKTERNAARRERDEVREECIPQFDFDERYKQAVIEAGGDFTTEPHKVIEVLRQRVEDLTAETEHWKALYSETWDNMRLAADKAVEYIEEAMKLHDQIEDLNAQLLGARAMTKAVTKELDTLRNEMDEEDG